MVTIIYKNIQVIKGVLQVIKIDVSHISFIKTDWIDINLI